MDLAESAAYLRHHLKLAGREEPLFADDAVARLHRVANGLPRALNNATTAAGRHGRVRARRRACRRRDDTRSSGRTGLVHRQDFIERVAARSRQDAFPVVDWAGTLVGVVVTGLLARIPAARRAELRLDQVALAVPPPYLAAPTDPAAPLLARRPLGGEVLAVVLADGRIAGMVTISDLRQAVRWRGLAAGPRAHKPAPPGTWAASLARS